jgi:transposase-like protein
MAIAREQFKTITITKWSMKPVCPWCSSVDCRRATRHGVRDFVHRLVGIFPWRCGLCGSRFYLSKRSQNTRALKERARYAPSKIIDTFPVEKL